MSLQAVMFWDGSKWQINSGEFPGEGSLYYYQTTPSACPDGGTWVNDLGEPVSGFTVVEGPCFLP